MTDSDRVSRLQAQIIELLPALNAFARRFHAAHSDADDLIQETVMKALSNLEKFEDGTSLKSWLFTIMRNAFCSRYASAKREAPGSVECVADLRTTPPSQEWTMLAQEVSKEFDKMPDYYRGVLERIAVRGQSYDDVALELHCAVGTVKSRLNRARTRLLDRFGSLDE